MSKKTQYGYIDFDDYKNIPKPNEKEYQITYNLDTIKIDKKKIQEIILSENPDLKDFQEITVYDNSDLKKMIGSMKEKLIKREKKNINI